MAISRFVVGTTVTLPGGTATAVPGGGGAASYAGAGTGATLQWADGYPATFNAGQVIYADSAAPGSTPTGSQQLYTALAAAGANMFAFRDGIDAVGHGGLSN